MNKEKPSLPPGWVVKQSKSYPDLVYYFNKHTGVSTWNMPKLVNPNQANATQSSKQPRPSHTAAKEKTSLTPKFSSNDDSDSSASFSDTEKDPKNEPVFSKFQKEIFDDVITNDIKHEPRTPGKELISSEGETEKVHTDSSCKLPRKVKWDVGKEVEYIGKGVEFPKVSVKTEKPGSGDCGTKSSKKKDDHTKSAPFNISEVLSKIRKDVENAECDLRSTLSSSGRKRIVESDKGSKNSSRRSESVNTSAGTKRKSTTVDDTVRKVVRPSDKETNAKDVSTPVVKGEQSTRTVQKSSEKLSTPGGKGIWTRKRRICPGTVNDEVPAKSRAKSDLSLEVCVGEKRTVIVSPKRAVVARTVSSDSLDLTAQSPPLQPEQLITLKSGVSSSHSGNVEIDALTDNLSDKVRRRKVSVVTKADVRKVVSSDSPSDTNTNNSGLSEHVMPQKPLQADRLGRVQAWVDHIDEIRVSKSEASPVVLSSSIPPPQALPAHHQDETEFCDMEVDDESIDEQMIIDLQEVRGEHQFCPSQPVSDQCKVSIPTCIVPPSQDSSQCLYLIVDTSSLMNHLKSVSDIQDEHIGGYGLPVLVIPWVVLQELDALKDNRSRQTFSLNSQNRANQAVKYLNACFTGKHPRVIGQSPQEASELVEGLQVECNDDRVLQCCLQYKSKFPFSTVMMISEDVNLCSKAQVSFVESLSIKNLPRIESYLPSQKQSPGRVESSTTEEKPVPGSAPPTTQVESTPNPHPRAITGPVMTTTSSKVKLQRNQLDRVVVKVKGEIKNTLGLALEKEMRAAFDKIWKDVVYRKPPWSALDIMESFKKHWIAVFGLILPKYISPVIDSIVTKLQLNKVPLLSVQEVTELIQDIITVMTSLKKHSSYNGKVDKSVDKLNAILSDLQNGNISQSVVSPPSRVPVPTVSDHVTAVRQPSQNSSIPAHRKQDSVLPQRPLPQTSSKTANKVRSEQSSKEKEQSNKSTRSDKSLVIPSTSANPKMSVKPASSTMTKSMTKTSIPVEDLQTVENCFQTVWQGIHAVCVQIEMSLVKSITNEDISLLNRLLPLIKDLRYDFAISLSISPYEIYNEKKQFEDLCNQLNSFFSRLKHEPVEMKPVTTDALQAYFRSTDKRPSLQIGLGQLDDIIRNLYELIKNLPD